MSSTVETGVTEMRGSSVASRSCTGATEDVSVVIPCYNEERFIVKALEQLADQYDKEHYEILVIDGVSEDNTRALIERFKESRSDLNVVLVDNPTRNIPTALNLGIAAARGNIIARMDAHAMPSVGYIRRCVEVLRQGNAAVVGMPCHVRPGASTLMARAIASAVSHPFGIGDAKYRLQLDASSQASVDTVAFACFRKSLWQELGGFNELLLTNEDYDFNYRVRLSGQQVILDRSGHCDYFARTTLRDLAAQYIRYGGWKAQMVRLHPRSLKRRHLVAPLFVLSIVLLGLLGLVWLPFWLLLGFEIGSYFLLGLGFGWAIMCRNAGGIRMWLIMPFVFATIHLTWGSSFLLGLIRKPR
jgi:cellulose synthase/poly-beta-1,6-N-acetylglucosamine synthase-like glycosyltransferase